ncbi:primosomal protein N' (replication factor Y) [Dysgonomonadaceae bacterium PH5-43]|nr:primosomal protein N' (replication factor Y) [Dysgonomonadaceae bacterium PH5-43]
MYIEVVLPVPLGNTFTYFVPPQMEAQIVSGCIVLVSFGRAKHYGLVSHIKQVPPEETIKIKPIISVESPQSVIIRPQLRFWEWIANYYLCSLGEVFKAVVPAGLRLESAQYTKKKETFVRLTSEYSNSDKLQEAFTKTKRSPKQEHLLLSFIQLLKQDKLKQGISKRELLDKSKASDSTLKGLLNKDILETYDEYISRLETYDKDIADANTLSPLQEDAYKQLMLSFREKDVSLLHGVTSSGKTEIYIHVIKEALKLNKQVLYLVPEISLSEQLTERLKKFFGDKLGVYHSGINNNERVEIWNNQLSDNAYQVILGVRSSIFLPYKDLGLIIVDEEHESSYKQQDPAPRYNARNAAIVLATMHGAKVILGSATPSVESYYNASKGKYGYIKLEKRFENTELPNITPVDVKELRRKKLMKSIFSPILIDKMKETLDNGEQVLLFQNRRGFAPLIQCKICDWTPKCSRCDISLNFHKKLNKLTCHYCGRTYNTPTECPDCGSLKLHSKGYGTEKIEEEVNLLFPDVSVERLDTDNAKKKQSISNILYRFASGKTKILVGTQMISKGLDFDNVGLVGIINADSLMNLSDFRAYERSYQLMSQVAGRAGRRKKQGEVILQTSNPEHPLIKAVLNHDYEAMYNMQIEERTLFRYPPLFRIIEITLKNRYENVLDTAATEFTLLLQNELGDRVIGPDKPIVAKVQNLYIRKILLKIEANASISTVREILTNAKKQFAEHPKYKYVTIQYDVDPN